MEKIARFLRMIMVLLPLVIAVGCGRTPGKARMEVAELGLSMEVPSGWTVDRLNPRMFAKGNSTGLILDDPLVGQGFEQRHKYNGA